MNSNELKIGHRFQVGRERGSVRYFGILDVVHPSHIWVGVDWDNQSRGKHNGSVKGKQYFKASSPTSGSFLKFKKFVPKCKSNESFIEAVKERYINSNRMFIKNGDDDILTIGEDEEEDGEFETRKKRKPKVNIQLVGMGEVAKKLADLDTLTKVTLPDRFVQTIDENLGAVLPNLVDVDLSHTLIFDFHTHVFSLSRQLPKLRSINVSENRFFIDEQAKSTDEKFENLKLLVMNRCRLTFKEIIFIANHYPCLKELHICGNQLEDLNTTNEEDSTYILPESLEAIHLANNNLTSFENVVLKNSRICFLPNLKTLNLNSNNFSSFPNFSTIPNTFPVLEHLAVARNHLTELCESVDLMNDCFPSLTSLVIFGNDLSQTKELKMVLDPITMRNLSGKERDQEINSKLRLLVVGKLGKLEYLNRSEIVKAERRDSEKYFLKRFFFSKIVNNSISSKKRMRELTKKYPGFIDEEAGDIDNEIKKPQKSTISLKLVYLTSDQKKIKKEKKKKLKRTMSVSQLKVLCKRLFKIDNLERIRIYFVVILNRGVTNEEEEKKKKKKVMMNDDEEEIGGFYGINEDTKELFIYLVDLEEERIKREKMKKEFNQSLLNQEEQIYKQLEWQKDNQYY